MCVIIGLVRALSSQHQQRPTEGKKDERGGFRSLACRARQEAHPEILGEENEVVEVCVVISVVVALIPTSTDHAKIVF